MSLRLLLLLLSSLFISIQADQLKAFVIAHSHCDAGWRLTPEEYYNQQVRYILDNSFQSLSKNPSRKFIWVETCFFSMWFSQQNQTVRDNLQLLVQKGQLEFIHGGWVMSDEASAHPYSRINQLTVGHEYLAATVGVKPRFGWHIDPFGASSITPSIFNSLGFDAFIHDRISLKTKEMRKKTQELQFLWKGSENLGDKSIMFTHVLDSWYWQPPGYNWDEGDPPVTEENIKYLADNLVSIFKERAQWFKTNHILYPFGHDFAFQNSEIMFENMDLLIEYINKRSTEYGVYVQYSTLSDYFDTIKDQDVKWPQFTEDYMPFEDNPWSVGSGFWVGHYSSRPGLKSLSRKLDSLLRQVEILNVYDPSNDQNAQNIQFAREISALMNHHDAITGTSKQKVVEYYMQKMEDAIETLSQILEKASSNLFTGVEKPFIYAFNKGDEKREIILKELPLNNYQQIFLANSLGWERNGVFSFPVRCPYSKGSVTILNNQGSQLKSQLIFESSDGRGILFIESTLLSLAEHTFFVRYDSSLPVDYQTTIPKCGERFSISNNVIELEFDQNHRMSYQSNLLAGEKSRLNQEFLEYKTTESGAYIFTPEGQAFNILPDNCPSSFVIQGNLVQTVIQEYPEGIKQRVILYHKEDFFENEIYIDGSKVTPNREVIVRLSTDIKNSMEYWTDNGMEMVKRNYDNTWQDKIASNYRPIIWCTMIKDSNEALSVSSFQSHGVADLKEGQLEIMIYRRLLQDDNLGMGEAMNDTIPVEHRFNVFLSPSSESSNQKRKRLTYEVNYPVSVLFGPISSTFEEWTRKHHSLFAPMSQELPPNVHLLTLQMRNNHVKSGFKTNKDFQEQNTVVIRLAHIFEKNEHTLLSQPAELDLNMYFVGKNLDDLQERSLSLSESMEDQRKRAFRWNSLSSQTQTQTQTQTAVTLDHHHSSSLVNLTNILIRSFFTKFESLNRI